MFTVYVLRYYLKKFRFNSITELCLFKVLLIVQVASIMIGRDRELFENSLRELTCYFFCRNTVEALVEILIKYG